MNDPGIRRHDAEVLKRILTPAQERVALLVPGELERCVQVGGVSLDEMIDLHRVIDDELDRLQRVDPARVTAEADNAVAHGGQVDHGRHAGEVLQQDARRREGDLFLILAGDIPPGEHANILRIDESRVLAAQQILEQDLQRKRQARQPWVCLLEGGQAVELERLSTDPQRLARAERIQGGHPFIILHGAGSFKRPPALDWRPFKPRRKSRATSAGSRFSTSTA